MVKVLGVPLAACAQARGKRLRTVRQLLAQVVQKRHGHFRRDGGRPRTAIRREVAEREVRLVTDRRNRRDARGRHGTHKPLVVETEQILETAAAASDDKQIGLPVRQSVEIVDTRNQRLRGLRPLHERRIEADFEIRESPRKHRAHVVDDRPRLARHDANPPRQRG